MHIHQLLPVLMLLTTASAHGDHGESHLNAEGIDDRNYMQRHVSLASLERCSSSGGSTPVHYDVEREG